MICYTGNRPGTDLWQRDNATILSIITEVLGLKHAFMKEANCAFPPLLTVMFNTHSVLGFILYKSYACFLFMKTHTDLLEYIVLTPSSAVNGH